MVRIIWSVIGIFVLIHGYFYVRYRTLDPCEAALARSAHDNPAAATQIGSLLGDRDLTTIGRCYLIGLVGVSGNEAGTP